VKKGRDERSFYNLTEYEWRAEFGQENGWSVKYYKGWVSTTAEAKYFKYEIYRLCIR
jgi:hypothetical protein